MREGPKLTILFYDAFWGKSMGKPGPECPAGCEVSSDRARLKDAHAVVFHIPAARDLRRVTKSPGQKWVAWSMESSVNYPQLNLPGFMRQFDLTMTYRWDSDIPVAYFGPGTRDELSQPPAAKPAKAPAVCFISNCQDRSGRFQYVRELMKYLKVDSYGRCLRNMHLAEDRGRETKLSTIASYRFTIAFENSVSRDYVTEKFFDPLIAGSVPVYLGAPNIDDFSPGKHCFIDVTRFGGPRDLAGYLASLCQNPEEYDAYLAWKAAPLRANFLGKVSVMEKSPVWRLCEKLLGMNADAPPGVGPPALSPPEG